MVLEVAWRSGNRRPSTAGDFRRGNEAIDQWPMLTGPPSLTLRSVSASGTALARRQDRNRNVLL
jgi:hypothetical protein